MPKQAVFISYSHSDENWAREFAKNLRDRGLDVWLDQSIRPGEQWQDAIEKGLRESNLMVCIVTPDSVSKPSASLFFELGAAIGLGKRVVPVIPADLDLSLVPKALRSRKY